MWHSSECHIRLSACQRSMWSIRSLASVHSRVSGFCFDRCCSYTLHASRHVITICQHEPGSIDLVSIYLLEFPSITCGPAWCSSWSFLLKKSEIAGSNPSLAFKFQRNKMILSRSAVKIQYCGSLRDREVAYSASDRQGSNFESCVRRAVWGLSHPSHHPQEVILA